MKLVLIRHGKTEGNQQRIYTGWTNTMLSEEGIKELYEYKEKFKYPKTDRYYTSDLQRAVDSFNILFDDEVITEKSAAFREVHFGEYEETPFSKNAKSPYYKKLISNNNDAKGETISQVGLRIFGKLSAIFREMKETNERSVTIVCHAGVIRVILMFLKPLMFETYYDIKTPNGLGYVLELNFEVDDHQFDIINVSPLRYDNV